MAQISTNPHSNLCKFGTSCKRENCQRCSNANLLRATPNQPKKVQEKQTAHPPNEKKSQLCVFWNAGICKWGDQCEYNHPPKTPVLSDILSYQKSDFLKPNIEDGMLYSKPNGSGLPELPPNGKCRICDSDLIIYFIPFFSPHNGVTYFKKIRLYRFNKTKGQYVVVFNYRKKDFHITSAAASNGYLVCSRLPYDPTVLRLMEEAKRLKKSQEILQEKIRRKDANHARQVAQLRQQNRDLSGKLNSRPVIVQRVETHITVETKSNYRLESLIAKKFDNDRNADPVDLFVYDSVLREHVHVLEYHKPADHVDLQGKKLFLWDMKSGLRHKFDINLLTQNVSKFNFDNPIQPNQLCDEF